MDLFSAQNPTHSKVVLQAEAENPLQPCPSTPNCVRLSYRMQANAEKIYPLVLKTLNEMDVFEVQENKDAYTIDAVFKIFIYKDDVAIQLSPGKLHTLLHIRSASRKGHYDFGVNRRRINQFIKLLAQQI